MSALRASALLAIACVLAAQRATGLDWHEPWVLPQDPAAALAMSDEYAWRLFVAVNWPADAAARAPDRRVAFGADRPAVWETWQNAADIFLQAGRDPGPWSVPQAAPAVADARRFETSSLKDLPNVRHIVAGRMQPLEDPIASARRLTEIRMNRAAFEYIRARELYNVEGQLHAVAEGGAVHFPAAAAEIKAKWRPIAGSERGRYHTVAVRLADGSTRLYGLTAIHIASKALPNWFWATFEHVDNPGLADADGWRLPSRDRFTCADLAPDCNRAPSGIGLEGTVWQYYRLRGTLTGYVDPAGRPALLANSELEAGMQESSSCMTCHARSAIAMVAGVPLRLPIFDGGAERAAAPLRRGYVGSPRAEWFQPGWGDGAPHAAPFQRLDFVWSLSKAQSKRGS